MGLGTGTGTSLISSTPNSILGSQYSAEVARISLFRACCGNLWSVRRWQLIEIQVPSHGPQKKDKRAILSFRFGSRFKGVSGFELATIEVTNLRLDGSVSRGFFEINPYYL
jgi:hypothetical protein